MADLSFLPVDFDENNSLLHRLKRQASHLLLRSPSKPPPQTRRRPATPTRTPVDDRSFSPYIPLANRYERSAALVRSRAASVSSTTSTDRSFPTTPLSHAFPTPVCATDQDDDHQLDLHTIRHSLSLPWLNAKDRPDHDRGFPPSDADQSDVIPDSPTLPPSLALPVPVPVLVLAPTESESEPSQTQPRSASRPTPVLHIPPAPSYPPPIPASSSSIASISDAHSEWDGETMVGDADTISELDLEYSSDPDIVTLDWTLHLSRPRPRPSHRMLIPSSTSSSVNVNDWTLQLPSPVVVPPVPAVPPSSPASAVSPRVSQCPSSWLSPFPHTSNPPPPLRKAKSVHSLLPLRPVPPYSRGSSFLLSP